MLSMGIWRTPSLKQDRPGYTLRICACFLSISFLMICEDRGTNKNADKYSAVVQFTPGKKSDEQIQYILNEYKYEPQAKDSGFFIGRFRCVNRKVT